MVRRPPIVLAYLVSAAGFALAAAGCGGGSNPPSVASMGSHSTTGTTSTSTTEGSGQKGPGPADGGSPHFQLAMNVGNAALGAKFSACMRSHGVSNFPDPNSEGVITISSGMGLDPSSPTFQSARTACQKLLPNGGEPTAAERAQMQQKLLGFSKCMRAHGIKDFPDPSDGGLRLHAGQGSDLDPNNPQFRSAQQACQGKLPFKGGATTGAGAK